ncbi:MAG: polysaccharide biosynthesis/export family protein [Desulfobacterales bacterium]|nr:polysaccharide biosynthesis/export family protein [Desulfobacterales bacterium]
MKKVNNLFHHLILVTIIIFLGGCASYTDLKPGTVKAVSDIHKSAVLERQAVSVSPYQEKNQPPADYLVGPGDVLFVNVNGEPKLGSPIPIGNSNWGVHGSRVDGTGYIHLPLIGSIPVAGLSISVIEEKLKDQFRHYVQNPWVVIEVSEFKSQPLYLLGQFNAPGTYYMDRPLKLLEGVSLAKGLKDAANLSGARLIRTEKTIPVDLYRILQQGEIDQNIWLQPGDTIFIPDNKNQNVFVFGAVQKPGSVTMPDGRLNLAQALAVAGLNGAGDNEEHIRIIRSFSATRGELIVVDMRQILKGYTLPFNLVEGDIIYVPRSGVGNWNQAIKEILPSLQLVSTILQPFVQIKFLTDDD